MTDTSALHSWLADHAAEEIAFLQALIQTPSEATPPTGGNELACQQWIAQAYRQAGGEVDFFFLDDVPGLREHPVFFPTWDGVPRVLANRPDVVSVFRGSGGGRSLLFSAHVDTVPAGDPRLWKEAGPFSGEIRAGKLYGRGSWDTKWGIAAALFALRAVRESGYHLRGDVTLESVADEEFGGSHGTLAARLRGYQADIAVNAEPTNLIVTPAHRGGTAWKITVRGDPGRGFAGNKLANPVFKLARIIAALQAFDQARSPWDNPPRYYESDPSLPTYIQQINGGGSAFAESIGSPGACSLSIWIEEHPGMDEETHTRQFQGFVNDFLAADPDFDGIFPEYLHQFRYLPGSVLDPAHPFFSCLERGYQAAGLTYQTGGAIFACDTYVFNLLSPTPALTIGPRGGNAHSSDEFVVVQDILDLTCAYAHAILEWCG